MWIGHSISNLYGFGSMIPCRIMDKHLKALAPQHINTKFIKLDAEVSLLCPFSVCARAFTGE